MARVDHYVGYPVMAMVLPHKKERWKFGLILEDGTTIRFYEGDPPLESKVAGEGKFLMAVTNNFDGSVQIVIGKKQRSPITPFVATYTLDGGVGNYSVVSADDPEVEWFPMNEKATVSIPEIDTARVQEGPSAEWYAAEEKRVRAEDEEFAREVHEPVLDVEEAENG